ncbi:MAG: hypothetical protein ACLPPV_06735 [Candidatus Korobacteraceae bacterium]
MAKPYGDDRRRKLLQAYDRGEGTLGRLAKRYSVSVAWAWKISAQRKRSGRMERVEQRRGGGRKVTDDVKLKLRWWLRENPDLTLVGLQRVMSNHDLHVSIGRLWQVLQEMGLRLQRSHSKPEEATPKRIGNSKPSGKRSAGSRHSA